MVYAFAIYTLTTIVMLIISRSALNKAPAGSRLPMNWGWGGQVDWDAPAKWAVFIIPLITIVTFAFVFLMMVIVSIDTNEPEWIHPAIAGILCPLFMLIHVGHLYFALRHVNKR